MEEKEDVNPGDKKGGVEGIPSSGRRAPWNESCVVADRDQSDESRRVHPGRVSPLEEKQQQQSHVCLNLRKLHCNRKS